MSKSLDPSYAIHRRRLSALLAVGMVTGCVFMIAGPLGLLLALMSDRVGSQAVSGVAYVCLAILFCDFVGLVVCGTMALIALLDAATTGSKNEPSKVTD